MMTAELGDRLVGRGNISGLASGDSEQVDALGGNCGSDVRFGWTCNSTLNRATRVIPAQARLSSLSGCLWVRHR